MGARAQAHISTREILLGGKGTSRLVKMHGVSIISAEDIAASTAVKTQFQEVGLAEGEFDRASLSVSLPCDSSVPTSQRSPRLITSDETCTDIPVERSANISLPSTDDGAAFAVDGAGTLNKAGENLFVSNNEAESACMDTNARVTVAAASSKPPARNRSTGAHAVVGKILCFHGRLNLILSLKILRAFEFAG